MPCAHTTMTKRVLLGLAVLFVLMLVGAGITIWVLMQRAEAERARIAERYARIERERKAVSADARFSIENMPLPTFKRLNVTPDVAADMDTVWCLADRVFHDRSKIQAPKGLTILVYTGEKFVATLALTDTGGPTPERKLLGRTEAPR